jgi:hypothetical protein
MRQGDVKTQVKIREFSTKKDLINYLVKSTNLSEDVIRRILLLLDFAIYTSEGKRTKFAKDNGIWTYYDLYKWLDRLIADFENGDFTDGISLKYNKFMKSAEPRAGAWIYKTYIVRDEEYKDLDDKQKVVLANLNAMSFINRTFGQLLQMIVDNPKTIVEIFKTLDKSKKVVKEIISGSNYTKQDEQEDKQD